jgi:hypothetical protein
MAALVPVSILAPMILTMHFILYPNSNVYLLLSWMPVWLRSHWVTIVVYGSLWLWGQLAFWSAIVLCFFLIASYALRLLPLVYTELVKGRRGYTTSSSLRLAQNITLEYRKIEVLHLNGNETFGWLIIPEEALIADSIMFCVYALMTIGKALDGATAIVLIIFAGGLVYHVFGSGREWYVSQSSY